MLTNVCFQVCSREVTPGAVRSKPSFARLNCISSLANCPNCDEGVESRPDVACPSEHLERVFKSFYTTKSSGTGMGLSICRSIIDAHGGRLWAEANEPRGVIFQFTLPAVP